MFIYYRRGGVGRKWGVYEKLSNTIAAQDAVAGMKQPLCSISNSRCVLGNGYDRFRW